MQKNALTFLLSSKHRNGINNEKKSGQTGWKSLDRDGDGQACDCLPGGNGKKCPKKKNRWF